MADLGVGLRRLRLDDAPDVLHAFQSAPDMDRQGSVTDLPAARGYVERLLDPDRGHEPWAITRGGRVIGLVCVAVDEENATGWFSYWMAAEGRGRGFMARAAATVANWALHTRGLHRLELGHRVNNPASGRVARAAGFVPEGLEREKFLVKGERIDVRTYGRLRSDPAPQCEELDMALD